MSVEDMEKNIDSISISVIKPLERDLRSYLDKCGLFYKIFTRIKGSKSVKDKLEKDTLLTRIYDIASHLENLKRQTSIHAAGVILSLIHI